MSNPGGKVPAERWEKIKNLKAKDDKLKYVIKSPKGELMQAFAVPETSAGVLAYYRPARGRVTLKGNIAGQMIAIMRDPEVVIREFADRQGCNLDDLDFVEIA